MSNSLVAHASSIRTGSPRRKLLLLALADNSSEGSMDIISYPKLAHRCECTQGEVIVDLEAFRKAGLIAIVRRFTRDVRLDDAFIMIAPSMIPGSLRHIMDEHDFPGIKMSLVEFDWGNGATESDAGVRFK